MSHRDDRHDPRSRLLAETFSDDWEHGAAADFARRAAAHARRRHHVRRAIFPVASFAAAALAAAWFAHGPIPSARAPVAPTEPPVAKNPFPVYEIISDAELEAALRDRPVLILPRDSARPRIVLLQR